MNCTCSRCGAPEHESDEFGHCRIGPVLGEPFALEPPVTVDAVTETETLTTIPARVP